MTRTRQVVSVALSSLVLGAALAAGAGANSGPNPLTNPARNPPTQVNHQWAVACAADINGPVCTNDLLATINLEHGRLHEPRIYLPANWRSLTRGQQGFVIVNLERLSNHYPPYFGLNAALTRAATVAAGQMRDVSFPVAGFSEAFSSGGGAFGGAWAGVGPALFADYLWMYDDGWGGSVARTPNRDCTSAQSPACWGHRDSLLGWIPRLHFGVGLTCSTCEVGVGYSPAGGGSLTVAIVRPSGIVPAMTFTWAHELRYFKHPLPTYWAGPASTTSTTSTTTTPATSTTTLSTSAP